MGLGHARTYLKGYLMAIEKTFIMIKADAVRDRKIGEIVARIELRLYDERSGRQDGRFRSLRCC